MSAIDDPKLYQVIGGKVFINTNTVLTTDLTVVALDTVRDILKSRGTVYEKLCTRITGGITFFDIYNSVLNVLTTFKLDDQGGGNWCVAEENFLLQQDGFKMLQQDGSAILF